MFGNQMSEDLVGVLALGSESGQLKPGFTLYSSASSTALLLAMEVL